MKFFSVVFLSFIVSTTAFADFDSFKSFFDRGASVELSEVGQFHRSGRCINTDNRVMNSILAKWSKQNPLGPKHPRIFRYIIATSHSNPPDYFDDRENFVQAAPRLINQLLNMWHLMEIIEKKNDLVLYHTGREYGWRWYSARKFEGDIVLATGPMDLDRDYQPIQKPVDHYCRYHINHEFE